MVAVMTAFDRHLIERLRLVRNVFGLSAEEAAKAAGVTTQTWRKWEKGGPITENAKPFICLCAMLNITMDSFFGKGDFEKRVV